MAWVFRRCFARFLYREAHLEYPLARDVEERFDPICSMEGVQGGARAAEEIAAQECVTSVHVRASCVQTDESFFSGLEGVASSVAGVEGPTEENGERRGIRSPRSAVNAATTRSFVGCRDEARGSALGLGVLQVA